MAEKKPGYVWTGKRWVKKPKTTHEKVTYEKEVKAASKKNKPFPYNLFKSGAEEPDRAAKSKYPGGEYRPMQKKNASAPKPAGRNLPVGTTGSGKKPSASGSPSPAPSKASGSARSGAKPAASAKPMKTVDQSRTEWVTKGTKLSDGTVVKKGYLAQKGKPEKKVTANVKIQTDTTSGKKAGQTYSYNKGKSGSQVKKK